MYQCLQISEKASTPHLWGYTGTRVLLQVRFEPNTTHSLVVGHHAGVEVEIRVFLRVLKLEERRDQNCLRSKPLRSRAGRNLYIHHLYLCRLRM